MISTSNRNRGSLSLSTRTVVLKTETDDRDRLPVVVNDNTVVLEVGSAYFRIGWAGEATPRHVIPSCLGNAVIIGGSGGGGNHVNVNVSPGGDDEIRRTEGSTNKPTTTKVGRRPATTDEWIDYLRPKLCHMFMDLLLLKHAKQSSSSGTRILVLESSGGFGLVSNQHLQCAMADILLKDLQFSSLLFVAGGSLVSSLYCFPQSNLLGLLVDIGHTEARCCISYQGRYLPQTYQCEFSSVELEHNVTSPFATVYSMAA
jgi:actin-related protein